MNLLDTWEVVVPNAEAVSFDIGTPPPPSLMHWRMDLAPDLAEARQQIEARATPVAQMASALQTLPEQFEQLAQTPPTTTEEVSFSLETGPKSATQEFWGLLRAAQIQDAPAEAVHFGVVENLLGPEAEQVMQQFQREAEKILNLVSYLAWVETRVAGELLGHTVMGWGSDARTYWATNASQQYITLHEQTLATALTSRYVVLRRLSLVLQGATFFSTLLSGQVWLAVPMLWQFVNRVVAEFQTPATT